MNSENSVNKILLEINKYIKKFYFYKALKGLLISLSILFLLYLVVVVFQYYFYFDTTTKTIFFWSFIIISLLLLFEFFILNILKTFNLTKTLSEFEAANYISSHFPEMQDKLINILELYYKNKDSALVIASINNKVHNLKFVNFKAGIKLSELKRYVKYLIIPIILFAGILLFNKSILLEGNKKFVDYSTYYKPQAPFDFVLLNDSLQVRTGEDLTINLQLEGSILPDQVYLMFGNNVVPMVKDIKSRIVFTYTFKEVNKQFTFKFKANDFNSDDYTISVVPSPSLVDYFVKVTPPVYTNKNSFILNNTGDLVVPHGSKLDFKYNTFNVDSLYIVYDTNYVQATKDNNEYNLSFFANKTTHYKTVVKNNYFTDSLLSYNLTVIPDSYPKIYVSSLVDSSVSSLYYFKGLISDDYGFTNLKFNYQITDKNSEPLLNNFTTININVQSNILEQEFYYLFDFKDLVISSDSNLFYYFSITDNDYYSGVKTSKTQLFTYSLPTRYEIDSTVNALDNKVQDRLNTAMQLANQIQLDIQNFNQKSLNENISDWEKNNFLNNLLQKQNDLNQLLDSIKTDNSNKIDELQKMSDLNKDLLDKQKMIQDMLNDLLTDELKNMIDSLNKMQDNTKNDDFDKIMNNFQQNYDDMSNNMDKSLQLLKRMQIEQELQNTVDNLKKMSDDLNKLSDNIDKQDNINSAQQDSILSSETDFQELQDNYDSLLNKNSQLDKPMSLDSLNEEFDDIQQDFDELKDQMFKNNDNKTQKKLDKTSQDLQELSDQMSSMMNSAMQQSNGEDMQMIKFLLTNILSFSFKQEAINLKTNINYSIFSDNFNNLKKDQLTLSDDFKIISDSLSALASRNPNISTVVLKELSNINKKLPLVTNMLDNGNKTQASVNQRFILESANKLALLLQESLNQMQNQMSMPGAGNPQPGNQPMPSVGDLQQMQQAMKQQLQQMMDQMQQGQSPGSQSFGEQMAQREAFQKALQDMLNSGQLSPEMQKIVQDMMKLNEDVKDDVINKQITPTTLMRDKQIQTKLLDAQNADNQRKFDNQRQSNSADQVIHQVPDNIKNKFDNQIMHNDILSKKSINLNNYLKNYYNEYIYRLKK